MEDTLAGYVGGNKYSCNGPSEVAITTLPSMCKNPLLYSMMPLFLLLAAADGTENRICISLYVVLYALQHIVTT